MRKTSPPSLKGFSLIEVALVLLIMGVMGSMGLTLLKNQKEQAALTITRQNQEYIARALANYVLGNRTLPLPAGSEDGQALPSSHPQALQVYEGVVPFKTLGIPPWVAKDGWGHYFTYGVSSTLSQPDDHPHLKKFCTYTHGPSLPLTCKMGLRLHLEKEGGREIFLPTNPLIIVLISHGPTGYGAYISPGEGHRILWDQASRGEKKNINPQPLGEKVTYFYSSYCPGGLSPFRQVILPLSRDDLLSSYGNFSCQAHLRHLHMQESKGEEKASKSPSLAHRLGLTLPSPPRGLPPFPSSGAGPLLSSLPPLSSPSQASPFYLLDSLEREDFIEEDDILGEDFLSLPSSRGEEEREEGSHISPPLALEN